MSLTLTDTHGRLAASVLCLHCGYNLRGTLPDADCPECGVPIRTSLRADRLADAPAPWLDTLRIGAHLMQFATRLAPVLLYLALIPATLGAWRLTTPQPGRTDPSRDQNLRYAARALLTLGAFLLAGLMLALIALVIRDRHSILSFNRGQYADAAFIAGHTAYWMGLLFLSQSIDALAARIPDAHLLAAGRRFRNHYKAGLLAIVFLALAAKVADWLFLTRTLYSPWAAPIFALLVAAIFLWLWLATLRYLKTIRQVLPSPIES